MCGRERDDVGEADIERSAGDRRHDARAVGQRRQFEIEAGFLEETELAA